METIKNIADEWGGLKNGPYLLSSLVKKSGLLQTGLASMASHNAYDVQEVYIDKPSGQFVDLNGTYTVADNVNSKLQRTDVKTCVIPLELDPKVGEGLPNGINGYISNKMPAYLEGLGQSVGAQAVYGLDSDAEGFEGIRKYCTDNSRAASAGTDASTNYTSILFVRWDAQGMTWIFNQDSAANPMGMFNVVVKPETTIAPSSGTRKDVIPIKVYADLALKIADPICVYSLVNVKLGTNDVTVTDLEAALNTIKADGSTFIYCNRNGLASINKLKDANLQMVGSDGDYNTIVKSFNGIPIVIDENITDTETFVTVS